MSELGTLHRYFIAANKMRIRFEKALIDPAVVNRFPDADPMTRFLVLHADDYGVFMFYWYSGLYVVIEGFRELKASETPRSRRCCSPPTPTRYA